MIFIAIFELMLVAAFVLACALAMVALLFGVYRCYKADWRNGILLLFSSGLLSAALYCIPHLEYYVMYGIRSKVVLLTRWGVAAAAASILISLLVHNRSKWNVVAGSIVAMLLLSLAW